MNLINTILIANRGEITSRIIRTCKSMGIKTIAIHSPIDQNAPYTQEADIAVLIGDNSPNTSYLNQELIIKTAINHGADAIHPGYGFLSENVEFAEKCEKANLIFIGPNTKAIQAMGSKSEAKILMKKHKVPTIPGYEGENQNTDNLIKEAKKIGFPLLLKATAGGGGKGMRVVNNEKNLKEAIEAAKRESLSAFGNDELIIEKYITSGRHIEFQIFGDKHGNTLHLLERECTIQRRHQKVLEESPSPIMTEELRKKMGEASVNAAKALNYDNAGTVEFIYDDKSKEFFFLEVNTRLQVEHPVTESITGLDLVKMQIESAEGKQLSMNQSQVKGTGYAVELRLYAEDPLNNFLPVTGKVNSFNYPKLEGLRVESAIQSGSTISVFYDPMIAKVIVHGENRESGLRKMGYVLDQMVCLGTVTNQNFLAQLIRNKNIIKGNYNTNFLDSFTINNDESANKLSIAASIFLHQKRKQKQVFLKNIPGGWRSNYYAPQQNKFEINNKNITSNYRQIGNKFEFYNDQKIHKVEIIDFNNEYLKLQIDGVTYSLKAFSNENEIYLHNSTLGSGHIKLIDRFPTVEKKKEKGTCTAPMPSQVIETLVKANDKVKAGDPLVILSSMKMENTIYADQDGIVEEIFTKNGANIEAGFTILKMKTN